MKNLKSMTVGELIEYLQDFPADLPVVMAYNYGDHCQTMVTATIDNAEEGFVEYSDYHRMWADATDKQEEADEESESDDKEEAEAKRSRFTPAVILR